MADFLNQVFNHTTPIEKAIQLIQLNRNFKAIYGQDAKYHDVFQSQINSLLSIPPKRVHGFLLIQEYLMEMPKDLPGDNLKNWATFCVSYIEGSTWKGKDIALQVLDKLLQNGHSDDNTRRKLSLHVVSSTVEYVCRNNLILVKCSPSIVFRFLLTCVTKYSGSCGSKKNLITNFIVKNIYDCSDGYETLVALLANIHYCPTPGQSNLTTKNSWFDHFCAILVNLNLILNKLATWGVGFENLSLTNKKLPQFLGTNEKEGFDGRMKLEQSYKALSDTICKMLQDTASIGLTIPVSSIFQIIYRASSVKLGPLYSMDPCLSLTILVIQLHTLKILEQLISTCKTALLPYSKFFYQSITSILDSALVNTDSSSSAANQSLSLTKMCIFDLKIHCYKVITKWFSVNRPNMFIDKDSAVSFFKHSMIDMKLSEKSIELRNVKKDKNSKTVDNVISIPFIKEKLNSLHLYCLKAMKSFVTNCFINLPSEQLTFFATFIAEEILALYRSSLSSTMLYEKPQTRKELLSLAVVLSLENETIPLSIGLNLLQNALNVDPSSLIQKFCFESLRAFNGIINPIRILRVSESTQKDLLSGVWSSFSTDNNAAVSTGENSQDNENERNLIEDENRIDENIDNMNRNEIPESSNSKENLNEKEQNVNYTTNSNSEPEPNVIMIQEVDDDSSEKEKNHSTETDDCIVYDPDESGDEGSKMSKNDKDDDLEIVDIKPNISIKRDDFEIDDNISSNKKPKIIQEDSQSQSSSRSLTIIEPSSNNDETNGNISDDIIKDFIAD